MRTYASHQHRGHAGLNEFSYGELLPCFELPVRAETVRNALERAGLGPVQEPADLGLAPIVAIHDADYVTFLQQAWSLWAAEGRSHPALPMLWRAGATVPRHDGSPRPTHIDGLLGYWSQDCATSMVAGTWPAVYAGAQCALNAARDIAQGARSAFALCRPPGHHAMADAMGGFCYLNNAALAAQYLRDNGSARVAVLDVDYHHGNGTQWIFYQRSDVCYASLHADPRVDYPFFCGHANELGQGAGLGANRNWPLPHGTAWPQYSQALDEACQWLAQAGCDALVLSLGVDTFEHDPISRFQLSSAHYSDIGRRVAEMGLPVVTVFEGGYATDQVGVNVVNVLQPLARP